MTQALILNKLTEVRINSTFLCHHYFEYTLVIKSLTKNPGTKVRPPIEFLNLSVANPS